MTRDEAIKRIRVHNMMHHLTEPHASKLAEALGMAIKALEGQKIGEWEKRKVKVMCPRDCWYPSLFAIEGTWNEEEGWNLEWRDGFCSECGKQDDNFLISNYCSNCGARMKGVEHEAD